MKWSVANVLIAIPLLPLFPVVATWFLPWENWIPKKFPKWFLGPYFLYVSYAAWPFNVGWFVVLVNTSGVSSTFPRFGGRVPTRVSHRRLAIRAARFGPEAECLPWEVGEKPTAREFHSLKKTRGH